jgi:hypothetical protein
MGYSDFTKGVLQLNGAGREFLIVGDASGKLWAFPRGHMTSQTMPAPDILVFDFDTHRVSIFSNDARGNLLDWLDAKIDILAAPEFKPGMASIRRVTKVVVEVKNKENGD